jgi:uncharacterized protein (AIM24 family)
MRSDLLDDSRLARTSTSAGMQQENPFCVRYVLDGRVVARQGAMVAYRGDIEIRTFGQGVRKLLKRAVTGEGVPLMEAEGRGDIWFADFGKYVYLIDLETGDGLSVNGKSVLCFDPGLDYEIRMIKNAGMTSGGLFNCVFSGDGALAITSDGQPLVIPVTPEVPVRVDTNAVIGWTATLDSSMHRSESAKSLIKGGAGEAFQLELRGDGFVIVQPSEGPILPKSHGLADAVGDMLG